MSGLKIISINCGSSSVKFSVFHYSGLEKNGVSSSTLSSIDRILSCKIEEIGTEYGSFYLKDKNKTESGKINFIDHEKALNYIFQRTGLLKKSKTGGNGGRGRGGDGGGVDIVVHRYVHGGKHYIKPLIAGERDIKKLAELNDLAPLHNPANLKGLEIMASLLPGAKQVCIFDTAFHRTIPPYAKIYPLPVEYAEKLNIEKYGFHGISYSFIVNLLKIYDKKIKKTVICHLGNGASICAVKNGESIDTSMGYTPLEGLMMGTRCGNIDPEVPFVLKKKLNLTDDAVNEILNKKSGLLGISKKTYDFKELIKQKDKYSKLALKMYAYRIVKFIGQYAAVLNGIDALVFTGGIGENSDRLRKEVCGGLSYLGVEIDDGKNTAAAKYFQSYEPFGRLDVKNSVMQVSSDAALSAAAVKVFVVHTDEELQMAYESVRLLNTNKY
ncbi:MAG: acetate/propionate family kinase [bacterium]